MNGRPKLVENELLDIPAGNKHGCRKHHNWVLPVMVFLAVPLVFISTVYLCENAEAGFGFARFFNMLIATVILAVLLFPYVKFKPLEYTYLDLTDDMMWMFWIVLLLNVMGTHPNFTWKTYFLLFCFIVLVYLEIDSPCGLLRGLLGVVFHIATTSGMDDYQYDDYIEKEAEIDREISEAKENIQKRKEDDDYNRRYHAPKDAAED